MSSSLALSVVNILLRVLHTHDRPEVTENFAKTAIGSALCFLNIALSSTGWILQRKAALTDDNRQSCKVGAIGTVLYILAALPDVLAYTYIPEVLAATIASFRIVVLCLLGHHFLEEKLKKREWLAISICIFGTLLTVFLGPRANTIDRVSNVDSTNYPAVAITYAAAMGILLVSSFIFLHVLLYKKGIARTGNIIRFSFVLANGIAYALEKVFNTEIGKIKAFTVLWIETAAFLAGLGMLEFYLNLRAARRLPAHLYEPMKFAFCSILQLAQGAAVFSEFQALSASRTVLTFIGALVALVGSVLIQQERQRDDSTRQLASNEGSNFPVSELGAYS